MTADVAVVGCGALGSVAAEILARSGVGRIRLIDRDVVEWSNLQRQSLYDEQDAHEGRAKADAATARLAQINRSIEYVAEVVDVTSSNIASLLDGCDLVIDASDNFILRFLINDWSLRTATPWVHGGCVGATGQVRLFTGAGKPCFRCYVSDAPPATAIQTCDTAGVIAPATHVIASLQAGESLKWLSGNRDAVARQMLSLDLWANRTRRIDPDPRAIAACVACAGGKLEYLEGDKSTDIDRTQTLCGREAVQIAAVQSGQGVDLNKFAERWNGVGRVQRTKFFTRLFPDDCHSLTMFRDGRVVVTGTDQISVARTMYDRYVGG
tara:strand:+ start:98322 stop:99293 length:972 start_codon:yes stop_codon:yes gene_type:complete